MSTSSFPYPIPSTPLVISPSPTPSEASERQDSYFAPVTRSAARDHRHKSPPPDAIAEEKDDSDPSSDSSLDKRARTRSRSPALAAATGMNGSAEVRSRRRMSGLTPKTPAKKSEPHTNGAPQPQENGHLSPYARVQKSWREFSRSPSPLGLIPLHRHYRYLIHKHEIPRKALHLSIGFVTLQLYTRGLQKRDITPWLLGTLIPIATVDVLRHRFSSLNSAYVKVWGALMRETEVDGYNGVIWYLLGAFVALEYYPKDVSVMSVVLLSWCDTAASTFGRLYGRYTVRLRRGKSLAGSLAAFLTGAGIALFFWGWLAPRTGSFPDDPPHAYMFTGQLSLPAPIKGYLGWSSAKGTITGGTALTVMSVCTGLIASVSEFIDILGWDDNLTIPVLSSFGLWGFLKVFGGR